MKDMNEIDDEIREAKSRLLYYIIALVLYVIGFGLAVSVNWKLVPALLVILWARNLENKTK